MRSGFGEGGVSGRKKENESEQAMKHATRLRKQRSSSTDTITAVKQKQNHHNKPAQAKSRTTQLTRRTVHVVQRPLLPLLREGLERLRAGPVELDQSLHNHRLVLALGVVSDQPSKIRRATQKKKHCRAAAGRQRTKIRQALHANRAHISPLARSSAEREEKLELRRTMMKFKIHLSPLHVAHHRDRHPAHRPVLDGHVQVVGAGHEGVHPLRRQRALLSGTAARPTRPKRRKKEEKKKRKRTRRD